MVTTTSANKITVFLLLSGLILFLSSCDSIFGTKGDETTDEIFEEGAIDPELIPDDVGYAALLPFWEDFIEPTDVFIGYDELVYITDEVGLHLLDRAGRHYETIEMDGAVAVTQDRDLNVYVSARYDTVVTAVDDGSRDWVFNLGEYATSDIVEDPEDDGNYFLDIQFGDNLTNIESDEISLNNLGPEGEKFEMVPDAEYEITFNLKTDNSNATVAALVDNSENAYWEEELTLNSNEWESFSYTFTNDTGSDFGDDTVGRIRLELGYESNENITLMVDDVELVRLDSNQGAINSNGSFQPYKWNLSAIYKYRDINKQDPVLLDKVIHPFDDASQPTGSTQRARLDTSSANNDEFVEFTGLATISDNTLYATRRGPFNEAGRAVAPDNTMMIFDEDSDGNMRNTSQVRALSPASPSLISAVGPSAITTFAAPPQSETIDDDLSFIIAQADQETSIPFRVLWINAEMTPDGLEYSPNTELLGFDEDEGEGFLYEEHRFTEPSGLAFSADGRNHIFVTDAATDSLYLFQSNGVEGVNPPPGSDAEIPISVSFGGTGSGPRDFRNPNGVAYFDQIVYIADTGNNRVARYRLNTDFE